MDKGEEKRRRRRRRRSEEKKEGDEKSRYGTCMELFVWICIGILVWRFGIPLFV